MTPAAPPPAPLTMAGVVDALVARRRAEPPIAAVCDACGAFLSLDYRRYGRDVALVYCCPRNDAHAGRRYVRHEGGAA